MPDWLVLRCPGRATMRTAAALNRDGYQAWTPIQHRTLRIPRRNVHREIAMPILPSFIFAPAPHLAELAEAEAAEPPPGWRIFRFNGAIPHIADHELEPLRALEHRRTGPSQPALPPGAKVRVTQGAFAGIHGHVERCNGGYALVFVTGFKRPLKIPTWLLAEESVIFPARGLGEAA